MLERIFDKTVDILEAASEQTGISYKKLNVLGLIGCIGITAALAYKAYHKKK